MHTTLAWQLGNFILINDENYTSVGFSASLNIVGVFETAVGAFTFPYRTKYQAEAYTLIEDSITL